jgi:nicotinamidase/pyrazinamidase
VIRKLPQARGVDAKQVALLVLDMQREYMPGGSAAVAGSLRIIPAINHYVSLFVAAGATIVLSRDVRAAGAEWVPALQVPDSAIVVSTGVDPESHSYSAFESTGLGHILAGRAIRHLWIAGVATEYGVRSSALDALYAGFNVTLLVDAIAGVDAQPGDSDRVIEELAQAGAVLHSGSRRKRSVRSR